MLVLRYLCDLPDVEIAATLDFPPPPASPSPVTVPAIFEMTAIGNTQSVYDARVPAASTSPLYVVEYDRLSGSGGTVRIEQGSLTVSVHDITEDGALVYLPPATTPSRLTPTCLGRTTCRVRVSVSATVSAGSPTTAAR